MSDDANSRSNPGDLFFQALVDAYTSSPRFLRQAWLAAAVNERLVMPHGCFILLTAAQGAGKSTFMAQLAVGHPSWLPYFIGRVVGLRVEELVVESQLLDLSQLPDMAIIDPARALLKFHPADRIVILVDARAYVQKLVANSEVAQEVGRAGEYTIEDFAGQLGEKASGNLGYLDARARAVDSALARMDDQARAALRELLTLRDLPDEIGGCMPFSCARSRPLSPGSLWR